MAVTKVTDGRKGVEIQWEPGDHDGKVVVFAFGDADDVHNTAPMPNDGKALVSYPFDFQGSSHIEVRKAGTEEVLDEGKITV